MLVDTGKSLVVRLQELSPEERRRVYQSMASTLAALHSVRLPPTMDSFGRLQDYCRRQVGGLAPLWPASGLLWTPYCQLYICGGVPYVLLLVLLHSGLHELLHDFAPLPAD